MATTSCPMRIESHFCGVIYRRINEGVVRQDRRYLGADSVLFASLLSDVCEVRGRQRYLRTKVGPHRGDALVPTRSDADEGHLIPHSLHSSADLLLAGPASSVRPATVAGEHSGRDAETQSAYSRTATGSVLTNSRCDASGVNLLFAAQGLWFLAAAVSSTGSREARGDSPRLSCSAARA
eukprot:CAMPEP_0179854376 /NCGR_PEP_ID=MMETSP0982-20121206/9901_1 /TAXON_ID=483367 /ORGANISM="non described non described, Strain CCMP 2436" /LENGTH=179 /DNA_ID=CAMNT_0021740259 /DNA_START=117 /DNA_END=658 /DNA_ORIENTATION=+